MKPDLLLRAAARAIYETVYPDDDLKGDVIPLPFEEAERFQVKEYRQAVEAARRARAEFGVRAEQIALL